MKIIIVGCGKVGSALAYELSEEGHDIYVIDSKAERISKVREDCDVMGEVGNGISRENLIHAGAQEADFFIAVTDNDELNVLACVLARKVGARQTVARVRNPEYAKENIDFCEELGISLIINPELMAAREIYRALSLPPTVSSESFSAGQAEIFKLKIQEGTVLAGMPVKNIPSKLKTDIMVCVVEREDATYIPDGEFVLQPKDVISIAGGRQALEDFYEKIRIKSNPIRSVMIVGGGKVAYYLAKMINSRRIDMTIVELNRNTCEYLCEVFPRANIINGNGSDQKLLCQEGIESADAFVALTGIDEENIILSLYARAKTNGRAKTITKINRIAFEEVISSMDLDTIINPKRLSAETIIQYVRATQSGLDSNIETVHRLAGNKAEALEFYIRETSRATGTPLAKLKLKPGILVALITREGRHFLPRGQDVILPGDHVIVMTAGSEVRDIQDILQERR